MKQLWMIVLLLGVAALLPALTITLTTGERYDGQLLSYFRGDYYLLKGDTLYKINNVLVDETSNATENDLNILLVPSASGPIDPAAYLNFVDVMQEEQAKGRSFSQYFAKFHPSLTVGMSTMNNFSASGYALPMVDWLGDNSMEGSVDADLRLGYEVGKGTEMGLGATYMGDKGFKNNKDLKMAYLPLYGFLRHQLGGFSSYGFAAFGQIGYGLSTTNDGFIYSQYYNYEDEEYIPVETNGDVYLDVYDTLGGVCFGFGLESTLGKYLVLSASYRSYSGSIEFNYMEYKTSSGTYETISKDSHSVLYDCISLNLGVRVN
jgi:hypothetical protein